MNWASFETKTSKDNRMESSHQKKIYRAVTKPKKP